MKTVTNHSLLQQERKTILLLAFTQFLNMVDYMIMMPLAPLLMHQFSISPQELSLLVFSYSAGAVMGGILGAMLIDQFDRKTTLLVLLFGFGLATLTCGLASSLMMLLIGRALAGMCGGSMEALGYAIIGDTLPAGKQATAIGKVTAMFPLAAVVGVPSGLAFASWSDWKAPFLIIAGLALLTLLVIQLVLPSMKEHLLLTDRVNRMQDFCKILTLPNHRRALIATAMVIIASSSIVPYLASYLVLNLQVTTQELLVFYLINGVFTAGAVSFFGVLADRYGKRRVFTASATIVIFPILFITHLTSVLFPVIVVCGTFLAAFLTVQYSAAVAIITSTADPRYRGRFMSINTSCEHLSISATALITGSLISVGMDGRLVGYNKVGVMAAIVIFFAIMVVHRLPVDKVLAGR